MKNSRYKQMEGEEFTIFLRNPKGKGSRVQRDGRSVMQMESQFFLNPTGGREIRMYVVSWTLRSPRVFPSGFK